MNNNKEYSDIGADLNLDKIEKLNDLLNEHIQKSIGNSKFNIFSSYLSGIDKVKNTLIESDVSRQGYVFIGRPVLNLRSSSLRQDRILALIDTISSNTVAFYIRCMLDPIFSNKIEISNIIEHSNLLNNQLPFIPLLTNTIKTMSGWPDPVLNTESTEGGFFSENFTFAKGFDDLRKSVTLTLNFRDIQGSPVLSLFTIWFRFIHLVTRGIVLAYNKYIEERKMCYSCSIYRFVLDTSGKYIKYWGKATGSFPLSYPIGGYLNYDVTSPISNFGNDISIPFMVNAPEMMDPIILNDFNMWIKRFCPYIENYEVLTQDEQIYNNFKGIPFINISSGSNELEWRIDPEEKTQDPYSSISYILDSIKGVKTKS